MNIQVILCVLRPYFLWKMTFSNPHTPLKCGKFHTFFGNLPLGKPSKKQKSFMTFIKKGGGDVRNLSKLFFSSNCDIRGYRLTDTDLQFFLELTRIINRIQIKKIFQFQCLNSKFFNSSKMQINIDQIRTLYVTIFLP